MNWKDKPRPVRVEYPDGTDWRCRTEGCGYTEHQDARPHDDRCPDCKVRLRVVAVRTTYS